MIDTLVVSNYGCVKDLVLKLSPLHALIGPNDSGKSTLLRALRTALQLGSGLFKQSGDEWWPFDHGLIASAQAKIGIGSKSLDRAFMVEMLPKGRRRETIIRLSDDGAVCRAEMDDLLWAQGLFGGAGQSEAIIAAIRGGSRLLRLDPDVLRAPSTLIKEGDSLRLNNDRGGGLAGIYDYIISRGDDTMKGILERVRSLFPAVNFVGTENVSDKEKVLRVTLRSGEKVPSRFVSDGLLYFLAFAAAAHLEPVAALLVEEPENGLHPARIAEVVRILREISKTTQVCIATHSPLVVNELQGDEVSVITRTESEGTRAVLLKDTPNFEDRSKVYAPGELWVSYADGALEAPLLNGGPRL